MHSLVSVRSLLFFASVVVFGISIILIQMNAHSRHGGDDYVRRNRLQVVGYILLFPALLLLGLAALHDQMSSDSDAPVIDREAAAAVQPYVPPVLPKPSTTFLTPNDTWKTRLPGTSTGSYESTAPQLPPSTLPTNSSPAPQLSAAEQLDASLAAATARIQANPRDAEAYGARGSIYAAKRSWDEAERDYQSALAIDGTNAKVKFNLAEMSFLQKKFDMAKTGFVELEPDAELGDLAAYNAFLCDLFGRHEDAAAKELDVFNQVGGNASYYFANAAWSINQRKPEDARNWLKSASRIYPPQKFRLYATALFEMGYLPLPPTPN